MAPSSLGDGSAASIDEAVHPVVREEVEVCVPRGKDSRPGTLVVDAGSRPQNELTVYGWSPQEFIRRGLLQFCFTDANDRSNQLSFIEQRFRVQLARWAWPLDCVVGAVVLA